MSGSKAARSSTGQTIKLPPPQTSGGKPLLQALKDRHSAREFSGRELPPEVLSSLLWAAFGINRPKTGGRTAPSAHDWEEIDVYAATAKGLYLYEPRDHVLKLVLAQDVRAKTGMQAFVGEAPLNLVYVADLTRMTEATPEDKAWYSGPDAGFVAQNVYLFCASEGLAVVVRGMVDRGALGKLMSLTPEEKIILAQTVGYPKA
ncbi:MAG TPA: nitroreductase family protein [Burkholderiales bacterium]|nr:nitroreductase family protein [Burkholderiales bacterium]